MNKIFLNTKVVVVLLVVLVAGLVNNTAEAKANFSNKVTSLEKSYTEGDQISFNITGTDSDRKKLTKDLGYHVQFNVVRKNSKDSNGVGFNAEYSYELNQWVGKFLAPEVGTYKIEIVLYCATEKCDRNNYSDSQQVIKKSFSVKKSKSKKFKNSTVLNEGYVTNDFASDQNPAIAELVDGSFVVYYNSSTPEGTNGIFVTTSKDGKKWTKPKFFSDSWGNLNAIADRKYNLLLQTGAEGGLSIINNKKKERSVKPTVANDSVGSIIKAKDGYYYVSYSSNNPTNVYLTRTKNLKSWSKPIKISSGSDFEFDSSLTQMNDGSFYVAYNSYSDKGVSIKYSTDGKKWKSEKTFLTKTDAQSGISMVVVNSRPVVFWSSNYITYYSYKTATGWTTPEVALTGTPLGIDPIVSKDGTIIAVYATEQNNQRDIKIKNLGTLNIK